MDKRHSAVIVLLTVFCVALFSIGLSAQEVKPPEKLMIYQGEEWKAQLYGFVKVDSVYNDSNVLAADSPLWVFSEEASKDVARKNGSLNITARASRLGFYIWGPKALGAETMARFEFDFWGGLPDAGASIRQSEMRLRLAYIKLTWPTKTYFLAGNDWMLGTPLYVAPDMLAFIPLAGAGLLFMREPQIAIGQTIGPKEFNVTIDASIARAQGNDGKGTDYTKDSSADYFNSGSRSTSSDNQLDTPGTGEAAERPSYKARITFRIEPDPMFSFLFGGSGEYMIEKHALKTAGGLETVAANNTDDEYQTTNVKSWYGQGFASLKIDFIKISGHYMQGANIDTYFGGIGQGIHKRHWGEANAKIVPVESYGGWSELWIDLRNFDVPLTFSFGEGMERVKKSTIAIGGRTQNTVTWGNFWWYLNKQYRLGVEVAKMETKYDYGAASSDYTGDNWKVQSTIQYSF